MEEKISIQKENVLSAYKQASEEQKALLENLFGKDMFKPKDIMERVKNFEDACEVLGEDHQYVMAYREWMRIYYADCKDITAYLKLRIICAALNEGWRPKFYGAEFRYHQWFSIYYTKKNYDVLDKDNRAMCRAIAWPHVSGIYAAKIVPEFESGTSRSSRLALKTRELAEYCGEQFKDIWLDYLFA